MRSPQELSRLFRSRGLRVTPQRECIFRILVGSDRHPTVEAIYETVRAELPTISLKTVYQTVNDLAALGEVNVLDLGTGSNRVDPNVEGVHHHLVCTHCGWVSDLHLDLPRLEVPAELLQGFVVTATEVVFRGLCAQCAGLASASTHQEK